MPSEKVLDWNTPIGPLDKPVPAPVPVPTPVPVVLPDEPPACPYNPSHDDMEKARLSAALCHPKVVVPYCNTIGLPGGAFQDPIRRKIYAAILRQFAAKKYIDPMLISDASGVPQTVFNEILAIESQPVHGVHYADIVHRQYIKRKLGELSLAIQDESKNNDDVFDSIATIQGHLDKIKPPDTAIIVRSLTDFSELEIDPADTLLGNRFLCREGGMLFVGPSGVGKSSASVQQDILWSQGLPAFGIQPARPLRIVTIQAENDDGDLTEMAAGIMTGLDLDAEQREVVRQNTFYILEKSKTGAGFIRFVEAVLRLTRPDILRLDPLQSYIGGDTSDPEVMSLFVHTGLNPLLQEYKCSVILNHHTPKTNTRDTSKWKATDWQYAGAGSAVLTNWARAAVIVDPCKDNPHLFRFIAAKRAYRIGWTDDNDQSTMFRYFKHAREHGIIFWADASPDEVTVINTPSKSSIDLIDLVPPTESIPKDELIAKAKVIGVGMNKARKFINELVADKSLFLWKIDRPGTRQKIELARVQQPEPQLEV